MTDDKEKRIEEIKKTSLKHYDSSLRGLKMFDLKNVVDEYIRNDILQKGLVVKNRKKCAICGENKKDTDCERCKGRICKSEICQPEENKCCLCVQFDDLFCRCTTCHRYFCYNKTNRSELLVKLGSIGGNDHPLMIKGKTCKICEAPTCGTDDCFSYKGCCRDCSEDLPDIWYEKIGAVLMNIETKLNDKNKIPMPVVENDDKTVSGAPLTILVGDYIRKGPYANCCECNLRWLYDSGLSNKGKLCDCECEADEDNGEYCGSNYGMTNDWIVNSENFFSDEERHLEIQETVTCCRDDYLLYNKNDLTDTINPCESTFLVRGNIAIDSWSSHHQSDFKKVVCSICANQFMNSFCNKCDRIFINEAKLVKHIQEKHSNDEIENNDVNSTNEKDEFDGEEGK